VTYRFGEHVTSLEPVNNGVRVTLSSGSRETYDLVVGADGLHSGVRALAFGDERRFLRHHGYRLAVFSLPNVLGLSRGAVTRTVPGRSLMVSTVDGTVARAQMIFEGAALGRERADLVAMATMLRETYGDFGWEAPRILDELDRSLERSRNAPRATDLYVDQIATVDIARYSAGRIALLGDAAWGGTLGGQGTPLAIVGAYVLAGELSVGDDVEAALARYESQMRPYASECQKGAVRAGPFFAPRTRFGLWLRDLFYRALTSPLLIGQFEKMVKASATAFVLPAYGGA
jgi:2-polyprenyl-6-methoxyphenol hydroxylase-like FAD-dependent oxidoreductase